MKTKYWLDKVRQAYSLGVGDGLGGYAGGLGKILGKINHDSGEEIEHKYATNKILEEIAQKIAIELTQIQEAKDETN